MATEPLKTVITQGTKLSVAVAGPQGPTGPAGGVTSVAGKTGSVTLVSADISDATADATANTVVKRNANGGGVNFAEDSEGSSCVYVSNSGSGGGLFALSYGGSGAALLSDVGTGATISTISGTYHAEFGTTGSNRSFVALVNGAIGWFRNDSRTLRIQAADSIAASRTYVVPDATGTIVPIVPAYANLTAANAALPADEFYWDTTDKKLRKTTA